MRPADETSIAGGKGGCCLDHVTRRGRLAQRQRRGFDVRLDDAEADGARYCLRAVDVAVPEGHDGICSIGIVKMKQESFSALMLHVKFLWRGIESNQPWKHAK